MQDPILGSRMKIAVITPYYKESAALLRQCRKSVQVQTIPCTHILVADGHPKSQFEDLPRTHHVIIPRSAGDWGNTPRGIGSLLASAWDYDAVAYLDADNWFEPDHFEGMVRAQAESGCCLVACKRNFYTLDGRLMDISEHDENSNVHVDTNCWLITRPAFSLFSNWSLPKQIAQLGDRIFFQAVKQSGLQVTFTSARTVAYRTAYAVHYLESGNSIPAGAKGTPDYSAARRYLNEPVNQRLLTEQLGFVPVF